MVRFHPGAKANPEPPQAYTFHNHPFHFYNHPPLAAYKLNKLLCDSRFKPNMRTRLLQDASAVAEEYGLSPELKRALLESLAFHHLDTDRPEGTPIPWWRPGRTRWGHSWQCTSSSTRSARAAERRS